MRHPIFWTFPFALLFGIIGGIRFIPGGPFISVSGDVLLPLCLIIMIVTAIRSQTLSRDHRHILWLMIVFVLLLLCLEAYSTLSFWQDRHARGRFIGL